jgi:hypothetical protein
MEDEGWRLKDEGGGKVEGSTYCQIPFPNGNKEP